jgi:tetratricopeptide (TPR) repeat protein
MKSLIWQVGVTCGLVLCVCSDGLSSVPPSLKETPDPAVPQAGRGGQKGGQNSGGRGPQGGSGRGVSPQGPGSGVHSGAGRGNVGNGQIQHPRGLSGTGARGGIHAPVANSPRNNVTRGHVAGPIRSPSFSHPPVRTGSGVHRQQPFSGQSNSGRGIVSGPAGSRTNQLFDGRATAESRQPQQRALDSQQRRWNGQQIPDARIGNQPFRGNSIQLNNRPFSVGHSGYQPSHYRHSGYHGYWNGNRRLSTSANVINAVAYGLGGYGNGFYGYSNNDYYSVYGNYHGYGSGWGWGLGSGYRGSRGYRSYSGYGFRPLGWGLGGWGLGSLNYSSGYLGYSNPYYINSGTTVYNYTQPIPVSYNTTVAINEADIQSEETLLTSAVDAFQQNDYDKALDIVNKGISEYPDDAVLHEFRALVLFAKQDYQQAAATIHSVLAVGPGWDWTTLIGMYAESNLYTQQLRTLEASVRSNPRDAASQFLLGYHYMTCGHPESAARCFQQVVSKLPNDRVAVDLLQMITPEKGADATHPSSPSPAEQSVEPEVKSVDPKVLVGAWSSSREDGSEFKLKLTDDANFTWSFKPKDQPEQEFGGTYTVEQNLLVLERKDGGSLIAEVTPEPSGNFNFRLLGTAEDDKGLEFTK